MPNKTEDIISDANHSNWFQVVTVTVPGIVGNCLTQQDSED